MKTTQQKVDKKCINNSIFCVQNSEWVVSIALGHHGKRPHDSGDVRQKTNQPRG